MSFQLRSHAKQFAANIIDTVQLLSTGSVLSLHRNLCAFWLALRICTCKNISRISAHTAVLFSLNGKSIFNISWFSSGALSSSVFSSIYSSRCVEYKAQLSVFIGIISCKMRISSDFVIFQLSGKPLSI